MTDDLAVIWGERVRQARLGARLSQPKLANQCNVAQSTVSRIENGEQLPSDGLKLKLAAALNRSAAHLFRFPKEMN